MAFRSAIFVARTDWQRVLAIGADGHAAFRDAVDHGLITDEMWCPFTELLAFQRVEVDIGPELLDALLELMGVSPGLVEPSISASDAALLDVIGYDVVARVSDDAIDAFAKLHGSAASRELAGRWRAASQGRIELHSSVDLGRAVIGNRIHLRGGGRVGWVQR